MVSIETLQVYTAVPTNQHRSDVSHLTYTTHYTLHTIHYTLYTIHYTLHTTHYTLHTIHYTLHTIHYTLHTIHYTLYNISIGGQGFDWHLLAFVHSLHASQYCACVVHFLLGSTGQSVKTKVSNFWQNISAKYDQRVCHETK